ncbi:unnamed protein product, partial [Sphacelaria rigidula]
MYRRCGETYARAGGQWQARERPRVLKHMGTADQSVRSMTHEVSEIQRWESFFREGGDRDGSLTAAKGMPSKSTTRSLTDLPAFASALDLQRGRNSSTPSSP